MYFFTLRILEMKEACDFVDGVLIREGKVKDLIALIYDKIASVFSISHKSIHLNCNSHFLTLTFIFQNCKVDINIKCWEGIGDATISYFVNDQFYNIDSEMLQGFNFSEEENSSELNSILNKIVFICNKLLFISRFLKSLWENRYLNLSHGSNDILSLNSVTFWWAQYNIRMEWVFIYWGELFVDWEDCIIYKLRWINGHENNHQISAKLIITTTEMILFVDDGMVYCQNYDNAIRPYSLGANRPKKLH